MIELKPLQSQVRALVEDLRGGLAEPLDSELRAEWSAARRAERTAGTFETWLEDVLDQAAVAWVLGCVFVRFCEDNRLVAGLWLGGAAPDAPAERAVQNRQAYLIQNPLHNDRHWLREAFGYLRGLPASGKLFDQHNPVWRFDISGDAAEALSDSFRRGAGFVSLASSSLETRFLGDLYQELSQYAQDKYALKQTPEFVEEFILNRTFEPALREFGLTAMSVIDPTCGSGHFLLGAFKRLATLWKDREPASDVRELVQRALHQVTGVDLNPFAVAIARFRLMVAALRECDLKSLERAPAFGVRVATGDSLLEWGEKSVHQGDLVALAEDRPVFAYATEDADVLAEYLRSAQYTVVVGNPPYITVKDKALNEKYRGMYSACSGKYALSVPFAQRFFGLAARGDHDGHGAGWVGQITANSFMKREFGRKLINDFFASQVDLAEVIDASGAFIPAHGTPTVILVGRNRRASERYSSPVRALLGVRGEPTQPPDPAQGNVWLAIASQVDMPGSESSWISAVEIARSSLESHPWSLSGGGASDLMSLLEKNSRETLEEAHATTAVLSITGDDEVFTAHDRSPTAWRRIDATIRRYAVGEDVRDWKVDGGGILWPYDDAMRPKLSLQKSEAFWPFRTGLRSGLMFGKTREQRGIPWNCLSLVSLRFEAAGTLICFSDVATHNHFSRVARGFVLNQHAPVIALEESASDDDYFRILGVLNSSTTCFWLKQVSQPKAGTDNSSGGGNRWSPEPWYERYEFTSSKLRQFPLPRPRPLDQSRAIDGLAQRLDAVSPTAVAGAGLPTRERLDAARVEWHSIRTQMITLQEELDWEVYRLYGLIEDDLTMPDPPELHLGERAFEIMLARHVKDGETETQWFARHKSTPITELPAHWPDDYRALVERRITVIESDRNIGLIERPECKRRWSTEGWDALQTKALRDWLLDRLEGESLWGGAPTPLSVAQLADRLRHDEDFRTVLDLWIGHDQHDLAKSLAALVAEEHVPYLPAQRYKPAGLRKRAQWERTWALQRREDNGEKVDIQIPPKYTSADFVKHHYFRHRGKLDVPKERFISYPKAGRDGDPSELLGWAGWDHLGQAQAIATIYIDRKTQGGWPKDKLLPLLAGLVELEPWLHQWYANPRPGFPGSPASFINGLIDTELAALGADRAELDRIRGVDTP